jgi:predicted ArsR family transcriptional regulator
MEHSVRLSGERDPAHESSRTRIARVILEGGPQTAGALAARLGVTPAAIRRHLDAMLAEGVVDAREQRVYGPRGRGRPAKVFALTDAGRGAFYQAYDDLAVSALRYIRETSGNQAVTEFARRLVGRLEDRYRSVASERPDMAGTSALAEALTEDGYAASVEPARHGEQLCQHHCPVAHVAEQFPQLCEAETEVFSRLLGRHVQRLATIAHGDGVCTTHVPRVDPATSTHTDPAETSHRGGGQRSRRNRNQPTTRAHRTGRTTS